MSLCRPATSPSLTCHLVAPCVVPGGPCGGSTAIDHRNVIALETPRSSGKAGYGFLRLWLPRAHHACPLSLTDCHSLHPSPKSHAITTLRDRPAGQPPDDLLEDVGPRRATLTAAVKPHGDIAAKPDPDPTAGATSARMMCKPVVRSYALRFCDIVAPLPPSSIADRRTARKRNLVNIDRRARRPGYRASGAARRVASWRRGGSTRTRRDPHARRRTPS